MFEVDIGGLDFLDDFLVGVAAERGLTAKHDVKEHSETPNVLLFVVELGRKQFRRHLEGCSYNS